MSASLTTASIEILEDGFFHPAATPGTDFVDENRWHHVTVSGLEASIQFLRAIVSLPDEPRTEHVLLAAHYPRIPDEVSVKVRDAVRPRFPDAALSSVVEWSSGKSSVHHYGEHSPFAVAAAAAAWMCFASWDESDPILVSVNGDSVAATMRCVPPLWRAEMRRVWTCDR